MSDSNATLEPCPFCGGEAETWDGAGPWHVVCTECGTIGSPCLSEAEAIEAWNTRAERTCHNVHEYRDSNGVLHCDARIFKCSECGFKANDFYGDDEQSFPRYCPNCGARVVG